MLLKDRFDDNERARLEKNDAARRKALGPDPFLDIYTQAVFDEFLELRRTTNPDVGILIPKNADWIKARHLRAMDREYAVTRSENLQARAERDKNKQGTFH